MSENKQIAIKNNYDLAQPVQMVNMAKVLKQHIAQQKLSTNIVGKDYAHVEGWQFAGGLMGMFPRIVSVENLSSGQEFKWKAEVEIVNLKTKEIISRGFAICSNKEGKKKTFDEYAVLSMAQTRAIGKAYRNVIGWVMKLAGYEATPQEEMAKMGEILKDEASKDTTKTSEKTGKATIDYLQQVKMRLAKMGAKTEKQALILLKQKTGLVWSSFKVATPVMAQRALAELLKAK